MHFAEDPGPGPGAYGPSIDFGRKGWSFGSSTRYQKPDDVTPGASDYKVNASPTLRQSAAYTFRATAVPEHKKNKNPGPGYYDSDKSKDATKLREPAISMGLKLQGSKEADKKPGPNEYFPQYEVKEHPGVSIKLKHEPDPNRDTGPGPGQYDVIPKRPMSVGKTFGGESMQSTCITRA